jgi:dolichyl-phosphate beta-glucosyltransferase
MNIESGNFNFRGVCRNLLFLGILLLAYEIWFFSPLPLLELQTQRIFILIAAVFSGFLLRSIRRKLFFGDLMSFHDSLAFEIIIQTKHALNPLLPEKSFESEFIRRETKLDESVIAEWIKLRVVSSYGVILTAGAWMLHLFEFSIISKVISLFVVLAVFAYVLMHHKKYFSRAVIAIIAGLFIWAVEGCLFAAAFYGIENFSYADAWAVYFLFTFLFETTPIPLGFGVVALPILILGNSTVFILLCIFHIFRLLPQLFLGFIYLPRFKFNINDFFNSSLIHILRKSYIHQLENSDLQHTATYDLSIVIPAYNEENRIPTFLDNIKEYLPKINLSCEIIVVDDGSTDNTYNIVDKISKKFPNLRLIKQKTNQGKGAAVRAGMSSCSGKHVMFIDADGATPIQELDKFIPYILDDSEVLIASRYLSEDEVNVSRKGGRAFLGMFFYKIVNFFAVPGIKDTQCGFKIFRKDIADKILARAEESGWAFDVEFLYIAQLFGCTIKEISVNWQEIEGSKVNPVLDSIKMLIAIFRIRSTQGGFLNDT